MRNILDFGAVGDGVTVNTSAIQAAIDMGGTVYIPAGVFVTGTLYLKSGGGLHLAPGAVLRASHNRADYNDLHYCVQNQMYAAEFMNGTHLITAVEQENVFIEGEGTIDLPYVTHVFRAVRS
jgi:polygalacturonase